MYTYTRMAGRLTTVYTHTYILTYTHIRIFLCMHSGMHAVCSIYVYLFMCICVLAGSNRIYVYILWIYTHTHTHTNVHVYLHTHRYVCSV